MTGQLIQLFLLYVFVGFLWQYLKHLENNLPTYELLSFQGMYSLNHQQVRDVCSTRVGAPFLTAVIRCATKVAAYKKLTVKKHNFLIHGIAVTCVYLTFISNFCFLSHHLQLLVLFLPNSLLEFCRVFFLFSFFSTLLISQKPHVSQGLNFLSRLLFLNQLWVLKEISAFLLCCIEHIATFCSPFPFTCYHELNISLFLMISFLRD